MIAFAEETFAVDRCLWFEFDRLSTAAQLYTVAVLIRQVVNI